MGASPGILSWGTGGSGGGGGGGIQPPIVVNYTTLLTLISTNGLTPGQSYQFAMTTAHYIQFSGPLGSEQIHAGTPEQLVVIASSANTLQPQAYSLSYPQDIIYYQAVFADREYDAVLGQSTGVIYYREDYQIDVSLSNSRDYDFRNVIFRRWETNSGSGVFDSITDTGFAYRDANAFDINSGLVARTKISSPGPLGTSIGTPYQLDNLVMDSSNGDRYLLIKCFAYGSTFLNGATLTTISFCFGCTLYGNISNYEGIVMQGITLRTQIDHCSILEFKDSDIAEISNCTINSFKNIVSPTAVYQFNTIGNASSITCPSVFGNVIENLNNNTCAEISANTVNAIENNVMAGASIEGNQMQEISNNTAVPANTFGIRANSGFFIIGNTMGIYSIYSNTVNRILTNTMRGDITNNSGYIIELNNVANISDNNVVTISSNTTRIYCRYNKQYR